MSAVGICPECNKDYAFGVWLVDPRWGRYPAMTWLVDRLVHTDCANRLRAITE